MKVPKYTGKILEVEKIIPLVYILLFPEEDRGVIGIRGGRRMEKRIVNLWI